MRWFPCWDRDVRVRLEDGFEISGLDELRYQSEIPEGLKGQDALDWLADHLTAQGGSVGKSPHEA